MPVAALRHALRSLRRAPALAAAAVLSLALGVGANAAILAVVRQVLLRPLPVPNADRLVNLGAPGAGVRFGDTSAGDAGDADAVFSVPMFRDLAAAPAARTRVAGVAAHVPFDASLAYDGRRATAAPAVLVSGSYFPVLGLAPARGRLLAPADDRPGAPAVAVVSHAYWTTQLGADPAVVGRTVRVNGLPAAVVGVAPPGFAGTTVPRQAAVFVPLATLAPAAGGTPEWVANRRAYWVYLFARLAPNATIDDARRGLGGVYRATLRDVELPLQPLDAADRARFAARPLTVAPGTRGQARLLADARAPLGLLLGATALVLAIAGANVANLLLARGLGRGAELTLRASLGASRARLAGLLLAESAVLAAAAGAAGLVVGQATLAGLTRLLPPDLAMVTPALDPWTVVATMGLALVAGLATGLPPALHASRPRLAAALRAGAAHLPGGTRRAARARTALVAAQVALSMTLLVTAGLFARSLANVARERLGMHVDRVVSFAVAPERTGYAPGRAPALFARLEAAFAAEPGVTAVATARLPVLAGYESQMNVTVEGYRAARNENTDVYTNDVGPGFFAALGTPLLAGREFGPGDRAGTPQVAVVNEAFVRRFGLGRDAVGRRIARGAGDRVVPDREIVGVVADAKYSHVKAPVPPVAYLPLRQDSAAGAAVFYVRTALDPGALLRRVPAVVAAVDPGLPVERLTTLPAQVRDDTAGDRLVGLLAGAFALLATALAAVGLYGVLAYTVALRTRELGVRVALGASAGAVRRLVLGQVGRLVLAGGAAGLVGALAAGRLARSLLHGVGGADPLAALGAALVLGAAAAAAAWVPAARAARVPPTQALRSE